MTNIALIRFFLEFLLANFHASCEKILYYIDIQFIHGVVGRKTLLLPVSVKSLIIY
jgi:hypothetical protein